MDNLIRVFIKVDERNLVVEINSEIFLDDITGYIEIDQGAGDRYAHAQNNYFDKPLIDQQGRTNFIYENGEVRELAEEEKALLFPVQPLPKTIDEEQDEMLAELAYQVSLVELGGI